jgi:hypothetical protein
MRARSVLARVIVAVSTVTALTIGSGTTAAHAAPPGISIADASITEGNAGTSTMSFTLTYGGAPTAGVTVDYATSNVTAAAGSDYVATSGTATLSATGCKCGTINVSIIGDTVAENTETFHLNLSNPVNKTLDDNLGIGTITDNDVPSASINDPTVTETGGTMSFTVTLDASAPFNSVIGYTSAAGTATAGSDFTSVSSNLTITAGSTTGTINVPILDDAVYEGDETLTMNLSAVSGVAISDNQGTGTITEDDPVPAISVDDPTVAESGTMSFTVSLDAAAGVDVHVNYATSDNTAADGSDYTGQSGTATITAGSTSTTVDVPVLDDAVYEGDETLNLDLSGAVNGTIAVAQGHGTITDDEAAPAISVDDPTVGEADGTMTFTVSIDAAAAVDTTVDYATADGTATDGADYTGKSGTATITAGSTSTTVDVPVLDDSVYEGDETVKLDLSNPVNGTGSPTGTGTITDDEAAPGVSIADAAVTEGNSGTTSLTFTVSLTNPSTSDVTVDYATSDGTAHAPGDYTPATGTLTIPAGDTTGEVTVGVKGETAFEPNETLTVTLSHLVGGSTIDDATAAGTITNDDKQPSSLTLREIKRHGKVKARGVLEPASSGNHVKITLAKYKHGVWVKLATKSVSVRKLGDRDHDGKTDAAYGTAFPQPAKGRYRFTATFTGDANTAGRNKRMRFRL